MKLQNLQLSVRVSMRGKIMNKTYNSEEIKNRLLNIGEAIGQIAFDYIVELEAENRQLDAMLTGESLLSNELEEQLTNAKEIIKLLLWDLRNKEFDPLIDVNRAEQFLKE